MDAGLTKATATDHRPWLWVTVLLSVLYCFCFLIARLFAKFGMLWWDDVIEAMAHVSSLQRVGAALTCLNR
jgi:hypothetical protein